MNPGWGRAATARQTNVFQANLGSGEDASASFDPQCALFGWWSAGNRRDLPWRRDHDPYRVLVSEIMLQQTQVDRVVPFFNAFVERFPSFEALAAGSRGDVIRLWAGLGYNRRAVQLHTLARVVVEEHGGRLPSDELALRRLPGIGPYTVGAVLSIAFGHPEPALDTNVRRVVGRYSAVSAQTERMLSAAARALLPESRAGDWNQALMDLGSSICLRSRPQCLICPLRPGCASAGAEVAQGPRKKASESFASTTRYYRGRLLAQLRDMPPGRPVALSELATGLAARGVAEPSVGWATIGEALARDGLIRVECSNSGMALEID